MNRIVKAMLLPIALLALGCIHQASATTVCSGTFTMTQVTSNNFSCTTADGNLTFSNFDYQYTAGNVTGCTGNCTAPSTPNPTSDITVNFSVLTGGFDPYGTPASIYSPIYQVITDYSSNTTVNEYQTEMGIVQYLVTANNGTVTQVDGAVNGEAINGASGSFTKNLCTAGQFNGGTAPNGTCTPLRDEQQAADINLTSPSIQSDSSQNYQTISDTTFGVADTWSLNGGSSAQGGTPVAKVNSDENDFQLATNSVPEPGTFLLLGGALIGIGAIRRKKSA
jgi:hypothetical protein